MTLDCRFHSTPPPPPLPPQKQKHHHQLNSNSTQAFRGDTVTLNASRKELRARFDESRASLAGQEQQQQQEQIDQALADAAEAADFLRTFVVQARLNERGNYEMKLEPHHADTVAEEAAIRGSRKKE